MRDFSKYINIPYKHLGRSFSGCDCYGIIVLIFKEELGIKLNDYTELQYDKDWHEQGKNHIIENITSDWIKIDKPYKIFDCILFFGRHGSCIANHIGLYIGEDKFIHISSVYSSMVSRLDSYWEPKIYSVMRYRNLGA